MGTDSGAEAGVAAEEGEVTGAASDFFGEGESGALPKDSAICSPWSPQLMEISAVFSSTVCPLVTSSTDSATVTSALFPAASSSNTASSGGRTDGEGSDSKGGTSVISVEEALVAEGWTGLEVSNCRSCCRWNCLFELLEPPLLLLPSLSRLLLNDFKCRITLRERKSYQARQRNTLDGVASSGNSEISPAEA